MTGTRISALGLLAFVAAAPFALAVCSPHEAPVVSAPPTEMSVTSAPSAVAPPPPDSTPSAIASAPPTPVVSSAPPYRGRIPKDCKALEAGMGASFQEGACKTDADCTTSNSYCSCDRPIARSSVPKLEALNSAFNASECYRKVPPRPCPTCPLPPVPRCVTGKCQ